MGGCQLSRKKALRNTTYSLMTTGRINKCKCLRPALFPNFSSITISHAYEIPGYILLVSCYVSVTKWLPGCIPVSRQKPSRMTRLCNVVSCFTDQYTINNTPPWKYVFKLSWANHGSRFTQTSMYFYSY